MQFDRIASVSVGRPGAQGTRISANRIAFRVLKTEDATANTAQVEIYNLSAETRAKFESTDNVIVLSAGYAEDIERVVAIGDVTKFETRYTAPDRVTMIEAGDGIRALRDTRVSLSYDRRVSAGRILEDVSGALGLNVRETDADLTGVYRQGWSFAGQAGQALDEVTRRFGLSWSIQNGDLQVLTQRQPNTRQSVVLSSETGLIGSPLPLDDVSSNTTGAKDQPGLSVQCLLNPRLEPSGIVTLRSREYRGDYRIVSVEHSGDTRGPDWHSTCEVVEI